MRRLNLLVALGLGIVWLVPSGAMARGKGDPDTRERAAKKACLLGDVDKGAEILADLYVETDDPTFVYNQGRCFEQNGKNDQALLRFKEYQRKAQGLTQEDQDALRKRIEDLEAALGQHQSPPPVVPASPPPPPPVAPSTLPAAAPPAANAARPPGITQAAPPPEPEPSPPVYRRWWFWTGVGAVVAGGVVTGVLLTRKSAPSSPPCDGLAPCVP